MAYAAQWPSAHTADNIDIAAIFDDSLIYLSIVEDYFENFGRLPLIYQRCRSDASYDISRLFSRAPIFA